MKLKYYIAKDAATGRYLCLNVGSHYFYFSEDRREAFVSRRKSSLENIIFTEFNSAFIIEEI
jgi:hypothetical protein